MRQTDAPRTPRLHSGSSGPCGRCGSGSLTLAHVSSGEHGSDKPFGSVFWHNSARQTLVSGARRRRPAGHPHDRPLQQEDQHRTAPSCHRAVAVVRRHEDQHQADQRRRGGAVRRQGPAMAADEPCPEARSPDDDGTCQGVGSQGGLDCEGAEARNAELHYGAQQRRCDPLGIGRTETRIMTGHLSGHVGHLSGQTNSPLKGVVCRLSGSVCGLRVRGAERCR